MPRAPRPIRIEGDIAYVPLTKGYEAVIDAVDVPLVDGVCWTAAEDGLTVYAYRNSRATGSLRMHRLIATAPNGCEVDHIDGNGLNNRRSNLRVCTRAQNAKNLRLTSRNASGFKGVHWREQSSRWVATIKVDGRLNFLGSFDAVEAAAAAYAKASAELHGKYGRVA